MYITCITLIIIYNICIRETHKTLLKNIKMEFIVIENGIDKNWNGESEYNVETKAGDKVTIELDNCSIATGKVTKVEDGKIYYRKSNGDVMSIPQDMPTLNILRHGIELAV